MRRMLSSGIALSVCAAAMLAPPLRQAGDVYADRVVDFRAGDPSNPQLADTGAVLGPPDFNADSLSGFLTLGVGGSVTVEFVYNLAVDGPGADIQVWGDPANDEQVKAEVSEDGQTYHSFGIVGETCRLDLAQVGLKRARFVRVTDDGSANQGVSPGAELDAVEALHSAEPNATGGSAPTTPAPLAQAASTSAPPTPSAAPTWQRLGGPIGGLGYDIRMRPDNPDVMFVTDAWAGVHRSTDGGRTWQPANEGIVGRQGESGDAIPVFCLTIDPNNNDIVWAGLQELGQIYRSEDGGQTWRKRTSGIAEGQGLSFRGISVEPGNSNVVYAAAEIGPWRWAGRQMKGLSFDLTQGVLYKSTDAGLNWRVIWRGDNLARYTWIDPANPQTLYLSTGIFDREAANSDPQSKTPGGVGVLKSTDGGKTWNPVNDGLGNLYIGSLFMSPRDANVLLAGAGNNSYLEGSGIYLTTDGGAHWRLVMDTAPHAVTSVEFSVLDPTLAYAGGQHVFAVSTDGGQTWQRRERREGRWGPLGIAPGFPIDFQVDPRDPERLFANNYGGGNFLSEDGGRTWTSASQGYTGADIRSLVVDPKNPAAVFVNGRSGPFLSQDGGQSWRGINAEDLAVIVEGSQMAIDPSNPRHLIMTESNRDLIYWSDDRAASWQEATNDWGDLRETYGQFIGGVEALAFAPSRPARVFAVFGNNGCKGYGMGCDSPQPTSTLAISDDGGRSWRRVPTLPNDGMPGTSVVVHPADADRAWVAVPQAGVFQTTDAGATWAPAPQLASRGVVSLAIDSTGDRLFAGTLAGGLYASLDGGATWRSSSAGMDPNEPIYTIVISPTEPDTVYAGSLRSGVFQSKDGGKTWKRFNEGLRMRSVHELAFSSDGQTLSAGTRGEGVYRLSTHDQGYFDSLAPTPTPLPTATSPSAAAAPTAPSASGRGLCGPGAALPILPLGIAVWAGRRKRGRRS